MFGTDPFIVFIKAVAVGLILGAVADRLKQRSFFGWAAIGAAAAAVFPGLSLVALMALMLLPKGTKGRKSGEGPE